jgi:hypothetical protein
MRYNVEILGYNVKSTFYEVARVEIHGDSVYVEWSDGKNDSLPILGTETITITKA